MILFPRSSSNLVAQSLRLRIMASGIHFYRHNDEKVKPASSGSEAGLRSFNCNSTSKLNTLELFPSH